MVIRKIATQVLALGLIAVPALALAADPPGTGGDAAKGQKLIKKCIACHDVKAKKNKIGPTLVGVFGRKVGAIEGFKYSKGLKAVAEKGVVWNEEALFLYLDNPKKYIKTVAGKSLPNKMAYKLKKKDQRKDVIAYLKEKLKE